MAGETILANIVTEILKKLGSFALEEIKLARGVKKEVKKLQTTIQLIEAVISDAENKQVKDKSVGIWLKELKDLAYEADDILDEYAYDLMHQPQELNRKRDKVRNFISISSNPIVRSSKMGHEIKDLNQKFDQLARQRVGLGLQIIGVGSSSHTMGVDGSHGISRETYAFVDESKVLGRDVDKSNIINMLLANKSSCHHVISVIPIVGMGGLGKTTLAQFVYNDTVVESHFNLKIWVCVSDVFDLKKIFQNITNSIPGANNIGAGSNLNFIVNQLQQHLRGKRFLLVLDDVWNENAVEWNKLKEPLMVGAEGSKILVTTRSEIVASIVIAGKFPFYKLQTLEDDICLSIFEQRAFGPSCKAAIKTPTLVEIGKELVRKCDGLPLAAEVLGSLMSSKTEVRQWEVIRDSEIWDNNNPENPNKILPALKLSYDYLWPQVKHCFSYCSLFPKDSKIERETLIRLWVAEGFIQLSDEKDKRLLEEIGYEYFQILLWNSLFQGVRRNKYGEVMSFKMHDLIHDLAQSVAGTDECSNREASEMGDNSEIRRLLLLNVNEESSGATLVSKSKLRTLLIEGGRGSIKDIANDGRLFKSHRKLRVLDLSFTDIEELPDSIGDLKHLRYLDLEECGDLKKLPDSITRLYNLQTLNLKGCKNLEKFPKDLNRLIHLRHLGVHDVSDWELKVGQLTCLQTLSRFVVPKGDNEEGGGGDGMGMGELQCLNLLGGELEITGLERVRGRENAEKANLKAKKFIKQLNLRWGHEDGDEDVENHSLVLEGLQPHPNLRTLEIINFMGPNFPTWMSSSNPSSSSCLRNLVSLKLSNCDRCKQLPAALGVLPLLRFLEINRMLHLEEWPSSSSSSSTPTSSSYPSLESIKILECPELKSMPTKIFPLKEFYVEKSSNVMGVSSIVRSNLNTLTKLVVRNVYNGFEFLPLGLLKDNNVLQSLDIRDCDYFKGFNREAEEEEGDEEESSSSSSSLRELYLHNCPVLTLLPGNLRGLTSLTKLSLENIPGLMFLPLGLLKDNNVLEHLNIEDCNDFQGFIQEVEGDEDLSLSSSSSNNNSLWSLNLLNCPALTSLPDLKDFTSLWDVTIHGCNEDLVISLPNGVENRLRS